MHPANTVALDGHRLRHTPNPEPGLSRHSHGLPVARGHRPFRTAAAQGFDRQHGDHVGRMYDRVQDCQYRAYIRRVQRSAQLFDCRYE